MLLAYRASSIDISKFLELSTKATGSFNLLKSIFRPLLLTMNFTSL